MGPDSYTIGDVVYVTIGGDDAIPVTIDSIEVNCDSLVLSTIHVLGHQNFWDEIQSKGDRRFIKKVIYNPPATIIFWADGTKTVVKCMEGDEFDPEKGLAIGIAQKFVPKKEIKKWLPKNWGVKEDELNISKVAWEPFTMTTGVDTDGDPKECKKHTAFLGRAMRDLTDIFKSAVKGE